MRLKQEKLKDGIKSKDMEDYTLKSREIHR